MLPESRPRMIEFLIVTLAALTMTRPWMSRPSSTVPAVVIVWSPETVFRLVPAGTPVPWFPLVEAAVVTVVVGAAGAGAAGAGAVVAVAVAAGAVVAGAVVAGAVVAGAVVAGAVVVFVKVAAAASAASEVWVAVAVG